MTQPICPLDGAQLPPGHAVCPGCHARLRGRLRDVPGLLVELDVTLTRQASSREGGGSGVRLDFDVAASDAALALRTLLHGWARVWDEETPAGGDRRVRDRLLSSAEGHAAILATVGPGRDWAPDLAREVADAVRQAWAAIDRPPDVVFVGWCPGTDEAGCGRALYAAEATATACCRWCGARWDVESSRAALLASATHAVLPKPTIALALRIPVGTLHRWSSEGRIIPVWFERGQPLYELAPIASCVRAGVTPPIVAQRERG